MSRWPPRFLFTSGRPCVDFVLTGGVGKWSVFERWKVPGDLRDWLRECSLGLEVRRVESQELEAAKKLRLVIWTGAQAVIHGESLSVRLGRALNRAAAEPDLVPLLRDGEMQWSSKCTATQALSRIARDAIRLFGSDERQRLRECRNPHCPLLFFDTSRPGRRAWCTMRRCGNLQKTTRYRNKQSTGRNPREGLE